jgi:hypothetical protein
LKENNHNLHFLYNNLFYNNLKLIYIWYLVIINRLVSIGYIQSG